MTSQTHYYYTKVMTDLFYDLPEVRQDRNKSKNIFKNKSKQQIQVKNTAEFWEFAEGQMLDGLYWEYWYNTGKEK